MRNSGGIGRLRTVSRFALLGVIGGLAAGCSSETTRFAESPFSNPFRQGGAPSDPALTGSIPAEPAAPVRAEPVPAPRVAAAPVPPRPAPAPAPATTAAVSR